MRGRRPEPVATKAAKGNPGRRPLVQDGGLPALNDETPADSAPSWLDDDGRKVWDRLAPDLTRMRLLSRPDALTFGRYCQWFSRWLQANKALADGELVVRTSSEHVEMDRLNKHLQAALLIEKRLVDIEDRFGLNPAMRQRIFVQRSAAGAGAGHLFDDDKPSAPETPGASKPTGSPIGLLN